MILEFLTDLTPAHLVIRAVCSNVFTNSPMYVSQFVGPVPLSVVPGFEGR